MVLRSVLALALATTLVGTGCDEKKPEATPPPSPPVQAQPQPATPPTPPANAPAPSGVAPAPGSAAAGDTGSIKGTVVVTGKIPVMEQLKRSTDFFCGKTPMKDESVIAGKHGELANVIVHINGLPATTPPPQKVQVDQTNCMYRPRVQGMVAGQTLAVANGDPVLHNVHAYKGPSTVFNTAQVPSSPNIERVFNDNGTLLKMRCDVHPWMLGYVWVQNNPYFAVSDDKGSFEIKDVPVGTHPIEAWHERFGTKTGTITVAKGKPAEIKLEFVGTETAAK